MSQVPNLLSASRIFLAMVFPLLPTHWRLPCIFAALLTEFLDGYLARRWNSITALGQILDPIGDKLFILSTVAVLIVEGRLSWIGFVLIAMRDIIVTFGTLSIIYESKRKSISYLMPRISGKITTALQFSLLIGFFGLPALVPALFAATVLMSCLSGIDYLYASLHRKFDEAR